MTNRLLGIGHRNDAARRAERPLVEGRWMSLYAAGAIEGGVVDAALGHFRQVAALAAPAPFTGFRLVTEPGTTEPELVIRRFPDYEPRLLDVFHRTAPFVEYVITLKARPAEGSQGYLRALADARNRFAEASQQLAAALEAMDPDDGVTRPAPGRIDRGRRVHKEHLRTRRENDAGMKSFFQDIRSKLPAFDEVIMTMRGPWPVFVDCWREIENMEVAA